MRLQSVILPENERYTELYHRGKLTLSAGDLLSFDTYYNSFCFTKYREYTTAKDVRFDCRLTGRARVELCVFDGGEHIVCGGVFSESASLSAAFSELPEKGYLYPKITAVTEVGFLSGEYSAECCAESISCCIAICTYKRERFVLDNTKLLREHQFSFIDRVFVIDNGNTLYADQLTDDFIKVLPNRNYGGSGGFTRGLIEAHDGGYSHVILMDDDVQFHPQTLEQMTVFVSILASGCRNHWFSTGMLPLDCPCRQFELGAEWDGRQAIVHKHDADILDRSALLDNLDNPQVEYGGWWTLLMPVSAMNKGLPYPFFIKFDDVEYGMRKSPDTQIITMNGIAVRHEAFDRKKSFVLDYYNLRNELVVNATYGKYGAFGAARRFLYEAAKQLCLYRYDNMPLVLRAVNDFLAGTDFFLSCDEESLNKELMSTAPKLLPLKDIPGWNESLRCDEHKLDKHITPAMAITLGGHLIPAFMLKNECSAVPLSRTGEADCFRKRSVIQYQLGGDMGTLTKRSFARFIKYSFISAGTAVKLLCRFSGTAKQFRDNSGALRTFEFWRAHLGIEK